MSKKNGTDIDNLVEMNEEEVIVNGNESPSDDEYFADYINKLVLEDVEEIESNLDQYDYGDTVILKWKGNEVTKEYTRSLLEEDRKRIVLALFSYYRKNGFPFPKHRDKEIERDWHKLKSVSISPDDKKQISNKNRAGMDLVQHFTCEQFYSVGSDDAPSMLDAFNTDKILLNVLRNRIVRYHGYFNIHGAMLRQGFRSTRSSAVVSNFNCLLAKYFYEKYSEKGDWVYDYSMGFGHRLSAAMACGRNYITCDPWRKNIDSGYKMYDFLSRIDPNVKNNIIELNEIGSEKYCPVENEKKFSLVFSSPPYFTKELYDMHNEESGQSIRDRTYNEWINNWWTSVVSNISFMIKDNGTLILNMVSLFDGKMNILDDMLKVCNDFGFKEIDRYFIHMSQSHFSKFKKTERTNEILYKAEPIVVMKRI